MKRALFYLICFYSFSGFCQERFFEVYDYQTKNDYGNGITQIDTFYIIGGSVDSINQKDKISILKFNSKGKVISIYRERLSTAWDGGEVIWNIGKMNDKIIYCGQYKDSIDNAADGFVGVYNVQNNSTKIIFSDLAVNDWFYKLHYNQKNKIYFGGQIIENNNAILFLAAIDTSGNLLWDTTYNAGGFHYFTSLEPTQDGQLLVGGYTNQGSLYKNLMLKYDTLGNLLWEKKNGSANFLYTNGYSIETFNGDFVQVGIKATELARESMGNIIRYDYNRNILFNKTYNFNSDEDKIEVFNKVIELDDETLVIGGGMEDTIKEDDPVTLLLKTDKDGNVLWRRTYSYYEDDTHTYFEDFIQTNDGGFAITGYVIPPPAIRPLTKNDMFLLKVDEFGCLTPGCELVNVPEIKLDKVKPNLLQVYPNPVSSHLNLISTTQDQFKGSLKIYNIEGKLILQQPFANQINVANLPKGQYVISYWEDYEFVDSEVFIKQ